MSNLALWRHSLRDIRFSRIFFGGRTTDLGRLPRYSVIFFTSLILIWSLVGGYLVFSPKQYRASITLTLPGAGSSVSVNLASIGQASSSAASPYASPRLSPTENYKRLIQTESVIELAASYVGVHPSHFPRPSIKLIDKTNLIYVSLTDRSPEVVLAEAHALRRAFSEVLDRLREDEISRKEGAYRKALRSYKVTVSRARNEVTRWQAATGLVSLTHYGQIVDGLERRHRRIDDMAAELVRRKAEIKSLEGALRITATVAAAALKLRADQTFQELQTSYAMQTKSLAEVKMIFGKAHPDRQRMENARAGVRADLLHRGRQVTGLDPTILINQVDFSAVDERAALLEHLVTLASERAGLIQQRATLEIQAAAARRRMTELVHVASALEELNRDQQVAEAVFSSALARVDTSKTDFFASYPLVQTIEEPRLPTSPSSPSTLIGVAAGTAATMFLFIGLGLAWARRPLLNKIVPLDPRI